MDIRISSSMPHACQRFWKCHKTLTFCSLLARCRVPCACHAKPHLNLQEWSGHVVLLTFWLGNALRANFQKSQKCPENASFLDINFEMCFEPQRRARFRQLNFQKWSDTDMFVHFDFELCFAPQPRALFRHLNFKKCSEPGVHCLYDFETCSAPQPRTLFRRPNFQKWSHTKVFCTFRLWNVFAPPPHALFR